MRHCLPHTPHLSDVLLQVTIYLYDHLNEYNGDQMARQLNMVAKHSIEKAAARNVDCFTTVSEITARECQQFLERQPEVVTQWF